jgi:hypothetical protein
VLYNGDVLDKKIRSQLSLYIQVVSHSLLSWFLVYLLSLITWNLRYKAIAFVKILHFCSCISPRFVAPSYNIALIDFANAFDYVVVCLKVVVIAWKTSSWQDWTQSVASL